MSKLSAALVATKYRFFQFFITSPSFVKEPHFNGALAGKTIAVWGLAFKPRTDDIREAPALALIEKLLATRTTIQAFDPEAMPNASRYLKGKITCAETAYDALSGADALVVATEWNEFRTPNWERIRALMRNHVVFDGRNIYRPQQIRELGFQYYGVGRS